jgi:hypothetical protein
MMEPKIPLPCCCCCCCLAADACLAAAVAAAWLLMPALMPNKTNFRLLLLK